MSAPIAPPPRSMANKIYHGITTFVFVGLHVACFGVIWTEFNATAVILCIVLYVVRMWAITAGYHRYFSHRSYKTSRVFQFILAFIGSSATQKGVLWWAANHRHHHQHSDTEEDVHSPIQDGFLWSHIGWIMSEDYLTYDGERVKDLSKYPELRWIDKYHLVSVVGLAVLCYFIGSWTGAGAFTTLIWGYFVSTVAVSHVTFSINSLTHMIGKARYVTSDDSRNHWLLALLTLGEGWHNNHHYYQTSARQGFYWWEVDISYYTLVFLQWIGIVWDVRVPDENVMSANRVQA